MLPNTSCAADAQPEEDDRPLGSYTRIYPSACPALQAKYEHVLTAADELFEFSVLARTQKTLTKVLVRSAPYVVRAGCMCRSASLYACPCTMQSVHMLTWRCLLRATCKCCQLPAGSVQLDILRAGAEEREGGGGAA